MTSQEQRKEIQQYLLNQNMAVNIILEISDHMISQIDEMMMNGKTFEEAFSKTKTSWSSELQQVKYGYKRRVPLIQKRILQKMETNITLKTVTFSVLFFLFILGLSRWIDYKTFSYVYYFYNSLLLLTWGILLVLNFKTVFKNFFKTHYKTNEPIMVASSILLVSSLYFPIYTGTNLWISNDKLQTFYNIAIGTQNIENLNILGIFLMRFFILWGTLFSISVLLSFLKDIKKVKKYLIHS